MNKKILLSLATGALIGGVALNLNAVSAETEQTPLGPFGNKSQGQFKNMSENRFARHGLASKAEMLGISVEELSAKMETMTFSEILEEAGISMESFQAKRTEEAKARWAERGISQEEIASRLEQLKTRRESCDGEGTNQYQGSPFGKGRGK